MSNSSATLPPAPGTPPAQDTRCRPGPDRPPHTDDRAAPILAGQLVHGCVAVEHRCRVAPVAWRRGAARGNPVRIRDCPAAVSGTNAVTSTGATWEATASRTCLLYTSDAADEEDSVD